MFKRTKLSSELEEQRRLLEEQRGLIEAQHAQIQELLHRLELQERLVAVIQDKINILEHSTPEQRHRNVHDRTARRRVH